MVDKKGGTANAGSKENEAERLARAKEVQELAVKFTPSELTDDIRCENASPSGGFQLLDEEISTKLRSAFGEISKMAAEKIWSGDFNITSISFPIKC